MDMKKSLLFTIAFFGIISCSQDDDSYPNSVSENDYKSRYFYEREVAAQDSLTFAFPQNEEDGDPPPKDKGGNDGKPGANHGTRTD